MFSPPVSPAYAYMANGDGLVRDMTNGTDAADDKWFTVDKSIEVKPTEGISIQFVSSTKTSYFFYFSSFLSLTSLPLSHHDHFS